MKIEIIECPIFKGFPELVLEELPFYFQQDYLRFIEKFYNIKTVFAFVRDEGIIIPIQISKSKFLITAQLAPPFVYKNELIDSTESKFYNSLINYIRIKKIADRLICPANYSLFGNRPDGAYYCQFGTYLINLSLSEKDLFQNLHPKHRNVIRNAEKTGVEIREGRDQVEAFYDLYKLTMNRSSMSFESLEFFKLFFESLEPEKIFCAVAYFENRPQAAVLMPYTKHTCYYLYGATANKVEITGAMNYLHWKVILLMKFKEVKYYNFVGARLSNVEGTKLGGIQKFKQRFGAGLVSGYLWKMDINPLTCALYDSLVKIKSILLRRPFFKDIIDQEIAKDFEASS